MEARRRRVVKRGGGSDEVRPDPAVAAEAGADGVDQNWSIRT
jgi:hypothetical protein